MQELIGKEGNLEMKCLQFILTLQILFFLLLLKLFWRTLAGIRLITQRQKHIHLVKDKDVNFLIMLATIQMEILYLKNIVSQTLQETFYTDVHGII